MNGFGQELRITIRRLLSHPLYALLVISTLAVGVGLNTTMFSLVNAILMRPLAAKDPDRLVRIYGTTADRNRQSITYPDYLDFNEGSKVFSGLAATHLLVGVLETGNTSQQVLAEAISTNYFEVLGISATMGRIFRSSDQYDSNVVIISHDLWKRSFQGGEDIIGRTLTLNRQIFTIAGVAPQSFHGTFAGVFPALWVPLVQTQGWLGPDWRTDRNVLRLHVIGRLAAGVNINEARAAIQTVARRLQNTFPDTNRERGADVEEARLLPGGLRGMVAVFLSLFLLIVGLVLLTVCANLGNFVFIRTLARRREFSLRLALGAGRIHLLRKTFAESLILSFAGGSAGLILA
ncbi:MAG TPA: ABC transporter permease, partial [Acidobacteriota bacterium]|nr:ABC transporter permease [Acidobacteriota bacterium]